MPARSSATNSAAVNRGELRYSVTPALLHPDCTATGHGESKQERHFKEMHTHRTASDSQEQEHQRHTSVAHQGASLPHGVIDVRPHNS